MAALELDQLALEVSKQRQPAQARHRGVEQLAAEGGAGRRDMAGAGFDIGQSLAHGAFLIQGDGPAGRRRPDYAGRCLNSLMTSNSGLALSSASSGSGRFGMPSGRLK